MDIEERLIRWMDENEVEMFQILREEEGRFRAMHPNLDPLEVRLNSMAMANRRFIARALGEVLPQYLGRSS